MSDTTIGGRHSDAHVDARSARAPTPGSLPQEKVENRENVSTVRPEDYPKAEREDGDLTAASNRGKRAEKAGSGPVTGSGAGAGGGGNPEDYDSDTQGGGGHKAIRTNTGPKNGADAPVGGSR